MKYKVGDLVKIKSLGWYNANRDEDGYIDCGSREFSLKMSDLCGKIATIKEICKTNCYHLEEYGFDWTDEMIEGLVEEEVGLVDRLSSRWVNEFNLPYGYIFKDENGNIINAKKIVLKKKTKEYPKTYEECRDYIESCHVEPFCADLVATGYKSKLIESFARLLICRDAYWKIAGEEMGLGKPWKPDWENPGHDSYPTITRCGGKIIKTTIYTHDCPFAFPTPEMRDAFKENFDSDIEFCKEFL